MKVVYVLAAVLMFLGLDIRCQTESDQLFKSLDAYTEHIRTIRFRIDSERAEPKESDPLQSDSTGSGMSIQELSEQITNLQTETEFAMGQNEVILFNKELDELKTSLAILDKVNPEVSRVTYPQLHQKLMELGETLTQSGSTFQNILSQSDWLQELRREYLDNKLKEFNFFHQNGLNPESLQSIESLANSIQDRMGGDLEEVSQLLSDKVSGEVQAFENEKKALIRKQMMKEETLISNDRSSFWGANLSFDPSRPMELSLNADYIKPLSFRWALGLGIRSEFALGNSLRSLELKHKSFGGRTFLDYHFTPKFYLEGTYEVLNQKLNNHTEVRDFEWQNDLLFGFGRIQKIKPGVELRFLLLYRIEESIYQPRMEARVGFYFH